MAMWLVKQTHTIYNECEIEAASREEAIEKAYGSRNMLLGVVDEKVKRTARKIKTKGTL